MAKSPILTVNRVKRLLVEADRLTAWARAEQYQVAQPMRLPEGVPKPPRRRGE
jgi:hypothetical protein